MPTKIATVIYESKQEYEVVYLDGTSITKTHKKFRKKVK